MFYDLYCELCKAKGVTPTRAAVEMGLSKSTPTMWKRKNISPQAAQLQKIADYFDVSVDYLLSGGQETGVQSIYSRDEKAPTGVGEREVSKEDLKFALFGGDVDEITDAMYDEVLRFAQMVKLREEAEKKKE